MKKVVFSAVALVAFSFASMANDVKETEITETQNVIVEDECVEASFAAADAVQALLGIELSPLEEGNLILALYDACDANR